MTTGSQSTAKPFQHLQFLIRDWPHEFEFAYGSVGGNTYIKEILAVDPEEQEEELVSVRQYIDASFDKISCFLMPKPGDVVTKKDYKGHWSVLNEEFIQELKVLTIWVKFISYRILSNH